EGTICKVSLFAKFQPFGIFSIAFAASCADPPTFKASSLLTGLESSSKVKYFTTLISLS
ncbi:hypothetical protein A2U01_0110386, partial [Trifolium medium]|nr:hypothetical protein [Trifolium medium]